MLFVSATYKLFGVIRAQVRMRGSSTIASALSMGIAVLAAGVATATAGESPRPPAAIIVAIPITAPDSTEEDVAAQYGLELLEQRTSRVLARRLVVYRIADERPQAEVLKQIGADVRISSAQPNLEYMPPLEQPADPVVASRPRKETQPEKIAPTATAAAAKLGLDRRRASARRLALAPESKPKSTPRALLREESTTPSPPSRISSLGGKLAWPTADEPFVGTLRSNR